MNITVHKKSLTAILATALSINVWSQTDKQLEHRCRDEADHFRTSMPAHLQHQQALAVIAAINKNYEPLNQVRNARNTPPKLRKGVKLQEVSSTLTLYTPEQQQKPLPLLIYLHGGGWAFGSRNSCARFCMEMAHMGIAVLAVEYSLAPEHPFPAAMNDAIAAIEYAKTNAKKWGVIPGKITIGGDSAGGNLALAAALHHQKGDIHSLLLFYPVVKAYADNSPSWKHYGKGYGLDAELMDAFNLAYAGEAKHHPLISPFHAADSSLKQLPPLMLVAAERDILRDQGRLFHRHISRLGVKARYELIPGSVHLFITVNGQPTAFDRAINLASEWILNN